MQEANGNNKIKENNQKEYYNNSILRSGILQEFCNSLSNSELLDSNVEKVYL